MRDRPPRRVPAVGGAGYADATRLCDAGPDERLDTGPYVFLLATTPAVFLYGLLELEPEAGAPPVVRSQHVEAARDEVLDLGVEPVLGTARGTAVHQHDRPGAASRRPVQPSLHLQSVHRPPGEVLRRDQTFRVERNSLPQPSQADRGFIDFCGIEADEIHGVPGAVVEPDPASSIGRGERDQAPRSRRRGLYFGAALRIE